MAKGENGVISIANFGSRKIVVTKIEHGMDITPGGEAEGRNSKQFFTRSRSQGSFSVTLIFAKYADYENMMKWLERYVRWVSSPDTTFAPARVVVPSRNFDQVGVLQTGITYGDRVGAVTYTSTLTFIGSQNPMSVLSMKHLSEYKGSQEGLVVMHPSGSSSSSKPTVITTVGDVDFSDFGPDGMRRYVM